jgi:hypothetical protein
VFTSGFFVFAQSLAAYRYFLANTSLAVKIQTIFTGATNPEFREWQGLFASRTSFQFDLANFCQ